ncbi:hypothetical protein CAEBREN_32107 [Caenorhabditis brenneri]|uniref:Uncharacterized protein n=1 Tax=Caenorhabditis brenneri TaxID=135651 RepID=G0P710_CAEBE|nr:hypothetical protein CAEBREN_32107 [Caenorhabditis brenneri]
MGTYKYLLMGVSIFEILYSSIEIIVSPIVHSCHTVVLVLTVIKDSWIPKEYMMILTALFIYRFYVISGNPNIKYFNSWRLLFWISIVVSCGSIWGAIGYFTFGQDSKIDEFIRLDIQKELNLLPEEITYLAPHFYLKNEKGEKELNWISVHGMNGVCLIVVRCLKCKLPHKSQQSSQIPN